MQYLFLWCDSERPIVEDALCLLPVSARAGVSGYGRDSSEDVKHPLANLLGELD